MPGRIRKRGKNSWEVTVELERHPVTGRRRQLSRSIKGTKSEAKRLLVQLLSERDTGIDAPPGKATVADFLQKWLTIHARENCSPKTARRYEQLIRVHIVPVVGERLLAKLKGPQIQEIYIQARRKGLSARTALHCHRVLREALQYAVKWQLLVRNPADAVDAPRPERHEMRVLSNEEVDRLLEAADTTPYGTLIYVAVMTGLRQGELLGLRWDDVDLNAGRLHVRQTCQWLPREGFVFRQPKTYRSSRPVDIGPEAAERLHQHRGRQLQGRLVAGPAYRDNDLVFAGPTGAPIHPSNLRRAWLQVLDEADLGHLRFHDLRHVHASLLLQDGVPPKIVSERLGHSGIAITMDTYSHVMPGLQAEAAARLEERFKKGRI